jgi:hypothetical protein
MRTHLAVLFFLVFGFGLKLAAQQEVIKRPDKYAKPVEGVSMPSQSDKLSNTPWYVYSDRSNNAVYGNQTGRGVSSRLNFGEKLAVLEVSQDGSRLLVALDKDIEGRKLKSNGQQLGWIDADKLLLWEKCLVDQKYNIDKKAMILFTIDAARQVIKQTGNIKKITSDIPVFQEPSDTNFDTIGFHQGLFQFFPVFKKEGNFLLLGESFTLDNSNKYNGLKGWVKIENVSEWSHRIAWEKNWETKAVKERESDTDSIGIMVVKTESEARVYSNTDRRKSFSPFVNNEAPYLEMSFTTKRKPGPMGRFPILDIEEINKINDKIDSKPIKVGVIGEVMDIDGKVIPIQQLYEMTNKIKNLRKVNVVFVIDATESMEPYRKSVINGVKDALLKINQLYNQGNSSNVEKNDFLFGCLLYRDYNMEETTQIFGSNLSKDTSSFFKWLDNNMVLEKNKRRAGITEPDDLEEALFYGIKSALDDYGPDNKMSNYMIVIGDCGDHQKDKDPTGKLMLKIDEDKLIEEVANNNMNILAFQVHNNNAPAFDLFQKQIKSLIAGIGKEELKVNSKDRNLFELPEKADYTGKLLSCEKDKSIKTSEMSKLISQNIIQINEDVNGKIKNIAKAIKGQTDLDPWSTAKVIKFFSDNDIPPGQAELITKSGMNQEYEVGYTVLKTRGYEYPYFQTVVLYSRSELEEVVNSFRDLSAAIGYNVDEQRDRLVKALNKWFPKYFSGVQDNILKDLPVGSLLEKITGLKFGVKYQDITISKITDPKQISDLKIKSFVLDIDNSLKKLEDIYNKSRNYPARVEIPGDTKTLFVYIPGDVFPHE